MTITNRSRLMAGTTMSLAGPRKGLAVSATRRLMRDEGGHEDAAAAAAAREAEAARTRDTDAAAAAEAARVEAARIAAAGGDEAAAELVRLRAELAARDAALANFEGVDPAIARQAIADQETARAATAAAERAKAEAEGNWERVRELMAQDAAAREAALTAQIETMRSGTTAVEGRLNDLLVSQAFSDSAFIRDKVALPVSKTRQLYNDHVDIVDGNPVVFDKPRHAAKRTMVVDAQGKPMAFDAAIQKVINADPDKDSLLASDVKPGAASRSQGRNTEQVTKTRQERMAEGLAELRAKK